MTGVAATSDGNAVSPNVRRIPVAKSKASSKTNLAPDQARAENAKTGALDGFRVGQGENLTSNQGLMISDDQNSLKAGERGPSLLEDFHLREKITHFDHERIPERVVHARGAAAHGIFKVYEDLSDLTMAGLFSDPARETPVFVRFSTVAGSRGSADTPRDVRGFAVKFYTQEGVWDLVGNNMPVFFIQDAIKFPDLIHAVKPEPNNEIPQAQSAHDTFWDFVSLTPESAHMLVWVMSDRGIPRSFSMMEGFGVHTFRLVNAQGKSRFVKFHWKPLKGVHSLVWDEAQKLAGKDPDFNRRDMFDAIGRGDFLEWELGVQIVEEADEFKFEFDLLDATKLIPEELVPVRRIGKMTLNRNPDNYFAETEQVAFHLGHVVPGIDFTNDPLLQGRLFSYIDTQIRRVGPNFAELPINRPINPVHNNQRDGFGRTIINTGRVSYFPNSLAKGCPMHQPGAQQAFASYAERVDGNKIRQRSPSFADHFSQATLFWNSMADWEKAHIAEAFSFELNQVQDDGVRARVMNEILVNIANELAQKVSAQTGIAVSIAGTPGKPTPSAPNPSGPLRKDLAAARSPALSLAKPCIKLAGRKVAILAGEGVDAQDVAGIMKALGAEDIGAELIAEHGGHFRDSDKVDHKVDRPAPNAPSVIYDAVVIPGGNSAKALAKSRLAIEFVMEAWKHGKPILAIGNGQLLLEAARITVDEAMGVSFADKPGDGLTRFLAAMRQHRFPARLSAPVQP